jgi:hypothetical protein
LPAEPASAAVARRFVRDALDAWGAGELEDAAVLLTSELVTNALLHARSAPELDVSLVDGRLRVGVSDSTPVAPVRKRYGSEAATGRGLMLIETMASAWGSDPCEGGKVVWFELTADDHPPGGRGQATTASSQAPGSGGHDAAGGAVQNRRRPPGGPGASTRRPEVRRRRVPRP